MAAGRSTDELFWDNYRDIQIAGQNGAEVDARSRAHTLVVSWPWELLTLTETAPPPPKQFNRSLIALIILLIQISAISSGSWRNAYHELFWHRDLLIFLSYISSHQSVPEMVVGRGGVRGWNLTPAPSPQPPPPFSADPNHPGDNNELWTQLWAACVCMHLIKAPPTQAVAGGRSMQGDGLTQPGTSRVSQ